MPQSSLLGAGPDELRSDVRLDLHLLRENLALWKGLLRRFPRRDRLTGRLFDLAGSLCKVCDGLLFDPFRPRCHCSPGEGIQVATEKP